MTHFTFIRYFVPDSNEFAPGWYQTRNEGRTRIGDVPLSLSDALYDGPNRVIIDDNTPETNTLPISGGKGVDEFLITLTANSVVIDDDSEANVIVFERDVVITSIERQAGSEGASVAQYVITLSSGKTITLRNPASFTFQHLGDATRTAPIPAEDFVTAYEDGFAASDASHPDIIGDASGPSGVQGPMITGTATGSVTEDDAGRSTATGTLMVPGQTIGLDGADNLGRVDGTYGTMSFDAGSGVWTYTLNNNYTMVQGLGGSETLTETFTFTALGAENFAVEITITGTNDAPVVLIAQPFQNAYGNETKGQSFETVDLRRYFIDKDTNDELTLTVTLDDGAALDTIGLTYDGSSGKITGTFNKSGDFTVKAVANDGTADAADALTFTITVREPNDRPDARTGSVVEDNLSRDFVFEIVPGSLGALQGGNGVSLGPDLWSRETQYGNMAFHSSPFLSAWVYVLSHANEATQKLAAGQTVDEVFTFVTETGTFDVIITITGTNDAPTVATAIESQSGVEGQEKVIDLSTLFSDIDTGDTLILSVAVELDGNEITFDGSRNIISNPNASKMLRITLASAGTYTVTVVADDGNGGRGSSSFNLEVEADTPPAIGIPGSEDRSGVGAVTEDGTLTTTGVLEVTGVDNPQTLPTIELDGDGVGTYGTMTFDGSSWTYTLAVTPEQGGETQALTEGQTETETFTFTALGAENFAVEITITGTNDAPVVATAIETQSGVEGQEKVIDLSTLFSDIDTNDTLTLSVVVELAGTEIVFDGSRNIISDPNASKMLAITLASPGTHTVTVMADDGNGGTVSSSFNLEVGADTPPVIGILGSADRAGAGAVTEDGTLTTTGMLEVTDADNPQTLPTIDLDGDGIGTYGTMTFDESSGEWTYTLAVTPEQGGETQALTEGQTETETFTFTALGAENFAVEITITGTNDAPVVATAIETQSGVAGQEKVIDLSTLFSDIDTGDTLTLSVAVELAGTEIVFDGSINIISDPNASKMLRITLASADTYAVTVVADDGNGGRGSSSFNLEVEADTPPAIGIPGSEDRSGVGAVTEDGTLTATGVLEVTDVDNPPTLPTIELDGDGVGTYGTMTFDESSGEWTYTLNNSHTMVQGLGDSETLTETFTFTALGAENFDVEITITGVNDAPVLVSNAEPPNETVTKSQSIETGDLRSFFTDQDTNDELILTVTLNDGAALDTIGLTYDGSSGRITGVPNTSGDFTVKAVASDGTVEAADALTFTITVREHEITGTATGSVTEDDQSGTNGASERASEEPLDPPIYETLSEQLDDDLQPTSFELGGGETDII